MTLSAWMSFVIIMNVVSAMERRKRESKCDREPVTSFAETLVAYETAKSFGYLHSYLQITLGKKSYLHACINVAFYLFITFVGPRTKCKLFIYDVFVFLTHLMLF
jgi:hypothetical protein